MNPIRSAAALAQLFEEFSWFHDGSCPSLSPVPGGAATPDRVELLLRAFGVGGLDAGDVRTYQTLRLTATGVREWSLSGEIFYYAPDHCMEGAAPVETSDGFGLILDVPTPVQLVADAYEYEQLPGVTETVAPWTSDDDFSVVAPQTARPSPAQWIEALTRRGTQATWRIYDGPAHPLNACQPTTSDGSSSGPPA